MAMTGSGATTDIAIIGGGMVGLSLALLLAKRAPALRICLVEAFNLDRQPSVEMPPSFDARSTALAESAREIYQRIGLWPSLEAHICPIKTIHVSDRSHMGAARMSAEETGVDSLGYVVENRCLGEVLIGAARAERNIELISPAKAKGLAPVAGGMKVQLDTVEAPVEAKLAVVADGANSQTLQQLGIHTRIENYGQTALIANLALAEPHKGIAYERFTDEGPMALLPLQDVEGEHRSALVWTLPPARAETLLLGSENQFLDEVHRRLGFRAGSFIRRGKCDAYPLALMVAEEQVRSHLAVVGNAAHFLHPVAGQGFNLALRDVAKLAQVLIEAVKGGKNPGELSVLERYIDYQGRDQAATIGFSHSLPSIFGRRGMPEKIARNAGLIALDLIPPARQEFARFGAGLFNSAAKIR